MLPGFRASDPAQLTPHYLSYPRNAQSFSDWMTCHAFMGVKWLQKAGCLNKAEVLI